MTLDDERKKSAVDGGFQLGNQLDRLSSHSVVPRRLISLIIPRYRIVSRL